MSTDVQPRAGAALDVIVVVATGVAAQTVLRPLGAGIATRVLLSAIATLAVATLLLRRRGSRWADPGWRRSSHAVAAAQWAFGLALVQLRLIPPLGSALATALGWPRQRLHAFAAPHGNVPLYVAFLIPVSWGSAAFGEELLFRGFLLRRIGDAFGGTAGALGLASGLAYRWNGRNLCPLIIAHGLVDTVGSTDLYLGIAHA